VIWKAAETAPKHADTISGNRQAHNPENKEVETGWFEVISLKPPGFSIKWIFMGYYLGEWVTPKGFNFPV
jgi:hypothetical protein